MPHEFTLRPRVEIDGTSLSPEVEVLLEHVVVDFHLHTTDMFEVMFRDAEKQVLSQTKLKIASKVKISAPPLGGTTPEVLISGEVTSIEGEYDSTGSRAIVRGYDQSHRLHTGTKSRTFLRTKDSDIAQTVASDHQLQGGTIDDTKIVHDHVYQHNQSDWEFLWQLANRIGFEVAVTEGKLHFRKPTQASDAPGQGDYGSSNPLQLVFGQDLIAFYPRISAVGQVSEVVGWAWDAKNKQELTSKAPAGTSSVSLPTTPSNLAEAFGHSWSFTMSDATLATQSALDEAVKAARDRIGSSAGEAEGIARGNPKLKAGQAVSVSAVSKEFVGSYTLSKTRHVFDAQGYRTYFTVSGSLDRSLLGLVLGGGHGG
jgi:phage protein D